MIPFMICTAGEMIAAEKIAFESGASAEALMEEAGAGIARAAMRMAPLPGLCEVHFGKGHNGGDVLVAARHLAACGWVIREVPAFPEEAIAPLTAEMLRRLRAAARPGFCPGGPVIALDGILGIGFNGQPRGAAAAAIERLCHARSLRGVRVLSADLPSGLDADRGHTGGICVCADWTVTIGCAKSGLVQDSAADYVGRIEVVELSGLAVAGTAPAEVAGPPLVRRILPPRPPNLHKGDCGRIAIVAGSPGFTGAARLASAAAVRAGAGLVTLFAVPEIWTILAESCPPEVMVRETRDLREVLEFPCDALALGPGAGFAREGEILTLIREAPFPIVVDADALTSLARNPDVLAHARGPRLLTPHPGEMARFEAQGSRTRLEWTSNFVAKFPGTTLLLKGSRTLIRSHGRPPIYNSTGNPGMASGGMGDVLTGVCAAVIAQSSSHGRPPDLLNAAAASAWLCGAAADSAASLGSHESLHAGEVIENLGHAFAEARAFT